MKVTTKQLRRLGGKAHIISKEMQTYYFTPKVPYETGWGTWKFPNYLKGTRQYYDAVSFTRWNGDEVVYYRLKDEFKDDRPIYHIVVNHPIYEVEVTKANLEYVNSYYKRYAKLAKEYADLYELCDNSLD